MGQPTRGAPAQGASFIATPRANQTDKGSEKILPLGGGREAQHPWPCTCSLLNGAAFASIGGAHNGSFLQTEIRDCEHLCV